NNTSIETFTPTGIISAASSNNLSITAVAGTIQITNLLSNLSAGALMSTANLQAGHFNLVTAQHAAPSVSFNEPPLTRMLPVSPHTGRSVPDYGFYYDGTGAGNPLVVVQVVAGSTPASFDLGVTTSAATNAGNGIDLAGLYSIDANGNRNVRTDIHNVKVSGNLLRGALPAGAMRCF